MAKTGEDTIFMNGEEYEKLRPAQSDAYKSLVERMTSG